MVLEWDDRRLQVHLVLCGLNIDCFISDNEEVLDDSDALNWIVKHINKLTPQFPDALPSEENTMQFLLDVFIVKRWT